jgi:hypothetical protein
MDTEALSMLEIVSNFGDAPTSLEGAVATFLTRKHPTSEISTKALECVGQLALMILYEQLIVVAETETEDARKRMESILSESPVWEALVLARNTFCEQALQYREATGVSDLFLDLVEAAIKSRYTARFGESGSTSYTCLLSRRGLVDYALDADVLVRNMRGVTPNDVETTRFCINMGLHFRALCKVIDRLCLDIERDAKIPSSPKNEKQPIKLDLIDKADELSRTIGGIFNKPENGANVDLSGRMHFRFESPGIAKSNNDPGKRLDDSPKKGLRSTSHLILVLDPTDMVIVKPMNKMEENRGSVSCSIPLRSIIAAAADGEWLHVAVRCPDIGNLIKNGNMALKFESPGTCLIVKQYLDRSREVLRQELMTKVVDFYHLKYLTRPATAT